MAVLGTNTAAAQAFTRFGFGGRPDDALPADPVAWLLDQLAAPDPAPVAGKPTVSDGLSIVVQWMHAPPGPASNTVLWTQLGALLAQEQQDLLANAVLTTAPFRERLVQFWANHFAVMADNMGTIATAGAFVRDAIRPHATGMFSDMLLAVMQHPAMLYSLNNVASLGPQSVASLTIQRNSGGQLGGNINENLGRETLELYTVGVAAGYAQADVDAMAYLLTGWTVNVATPPYGFVYQASHAQPGQQTLLGTSYPISQAGCAAALAMLGTHPATFQHLAAKLVSHFVSDTPDPADIATVAGVLSSTGGNLGAAAAALVALPSAWLPLGKLRTPQDLLVASLRAGNATAASLSQLSLSPLGHTLAMLGQPLWQPPFPDGWSDLAADWTGPQPLLMRCDCMSQLAASLGGVDPGLAAASSLGPLLSPDSLAAIDAAALASDRLTLLFCSPEFQRR